MSSSVPKASGRSKGDTLKNMGGMEVALVSDILRTVGMKIAPLVIKEFSSIAGVTKDLQELQDLVEGINIWLQTVGDKAMRNDQSSNWLKKLKDASYDTEDLVHEFHIEAVKHDENVIGVKNAVVKYLWTKPKSVVFKCTTPHKIMEIKKRFDAIVKGRYDYSTIANSMPVDRLVLHISKTIGEVPLWTNVDETSIFGRDQVKNQIIAELIETNDQHKIKIVSVIGLGGSGKTTLAKLVFNDGDIIKKHFEEILWVHVSREFVVEKLVEKLFEAIAGDKPDHLPLQRVSRTISDKLAGKRFLLVLDDVWTEDHIHWEQFTVHLKSGAPGSSILLTTRSRKVADAVDSTYTCNLPFLSEEDSWNVFQQNFGISIEGLDPEFLQMGKQIVNKCGGVALAIKVLAGSLRGMKEIEEWQSIRDSNLLDVEDEEHRVSSCLWLSYFHLPHHLKDCFTHCSIFPRGYVIKRRHLISQWIARGFVNVTNQVQQPEDVGIGYFDSLLKVGFLQDQEVEHCEPISYDETRYKMHDLVHDLARKILHDEFASEVETVDQINRCRYVSLTSCTGEVDDKLFDKVRAVYISRGNLVFGKITKKHSPVRTIILKHISVALLRNFISKLEHLGYLEISNVNCEALPEAITQCLNLEAIHVLGCTRLTTLPKSIGKLKKLRALELNGSQDVKSLPQSIGGCDNLQRLILYNCGFKDIPNSIEKLEKLRVLTVAHSYDLRQLSSPESFGKLRNLQAIDLSGCWGLEHLPQCIILLCHLEYVNLAHCDLVELPEGIGNLKKLQVLNLQGCHALCGLPASCGQLTRLQKLGLFVVGANAEHARISELENLDKLNGELQIKNIEYVRDPDDAEKAHLKKKDGIQKLSLDWYLTRATWASDMEEQLVVSNMEKNKDLHLLNSLEPPSEIEELRISGYRGSQLPRWMTKQTGSCDLSDIHMQNSPPQFSRLTELVLENLLNLEHLQGIMDLPGIKILELRVMPKLAELLTTRTALANGEEELEMQCCFPRLSTLLIRDCPKLNVKPYFPLSLQKLALEGTNNEQLLSSACFSHLRHAVHAHGNVATSSSCIMYVKPPHLTQLNISGLIGPSAGWKVLSHLSGLYGLEICNCEDLRQLPESMRSLTCLHRLSISICMDLYVLPEWLGEFQYLQNLYIASLPRISNLPQSIERLTSLQRLVIHDCRDLHQLPEELGELCSLRDLQISDMPALTYLPKSLQRLTSLQEFHLSDCYMLTQLPESLGELSALRKFWIGCCPGLKSLPSSIQRLTALEELVISYCPELVRHCKEGVGKDWPLVSHIPDLRLHG